MTDYALRPSSCTVCNHPEVDEINRLILENKTSWAEVSRIFGFNTVHPIKRHAKVHLAKLLTEARKQRHKSTVDALADVERRTEAVIERAEAKKGKADDILLKAIARREAQLKLGAELRGELQEKRPNEITEEKKKEQVERAIQELIRRAASEMGLTLSRDEAIAQLIKVEPAIGSYVN